MKENETKMNVIIDGPQSFTEEQIQLIFNKIKNETKILFIGNQEEILIQETKIKE